jgi:hypothetical protein
VNLFRQAIPQVHWFYVFDGLCTAWRKKHSVPMLVTTAAEAHV